MEFDIRVTNIGRREGKQTVLLFMMPLDPNKQSTYKEEKAHVPLKQKLLAYKAAASVPPGAEQTLRFTIDLATQLAVANEEGHKVLLPGTYGFEFRDGVNVLRHTISVTGQPLLVERFPEESGMSVETRATVAL